MSDPSETKTNTAFKGTPYSIWSTENVFEDELESRTKHLDHLRLEYIQAGKYNEETEQNFQRQFQNKLRDRGILDSSNKDIVAGEIQKYSGLQTTAEEDAIFLKEQMVHSSSRMDFEEGEKEKVLKYATAIETGQELPEDIDEAEVEEIIRQKRQNYITDLYENDELGAGVYTNKQGQRVFLGGKMGENMSEADVIRQGEYFGVKPTDVFALRKFREVQEDKNNLMAYQVDQRQTAEAKVKELLKEGDSLEDIKIKAQFDALATALGKEKSWGWFDKSYDSTGEVLNWVSSNIKEAWNWLSFDGEEAMETLEKRKFEAMREDYEDEVDETKLKLITALEEKVGVGGEILEDVVDDIISEIAINGSDTLDAQLKFTDDEDNLSQNVLRRKYSGVFVQPALSLKPEQFKKALKDSGFSEKEIEIEDSKRLVNNALLAESRMAVLENDDKYADSFRLAKLAGTTEGLTPSEILEKYVADVDPNLGLEGIGMSISQSFSTLYYGVGALFGAEYGKKGLLKNAEEQAHLNQMRQIFGQDAGLGQQVLEQIAPLLVDGVITVGASILAVPSAGTSVAAAAGYFGTKTAATTTARALLKNTFNSALKQKVTRDASGQLVKETLEQTVKRLQKSETLKGLAVPDLDKAVKAYNSKLAKSLGIGTATFVPAAMRSGSMTYAPVYKTVYDDYTAKYTDAEGNWIEGWSEEKVKQVAHKAGFESMLVAGTTTGLITAAMGKIGGGKFGGLESAYLAGVSMRQMKTATDRMIGRVSSVEGFQEMMKDAVSKTFAKSIGSTGLRIGASALGEGVEEAIDEIANTIIQDAWTDKDTSFQEKMEGGVHGFILGAILGAGSPAIGRLAKNISPDKMVDQDAMFNLEQDILKDFRSRLTSDQEQQFDELQQLAPKAAQELKRISDARRTDETEPEGSGESGGSGAEATTDKEEVKEEAKQIDRDIEDNIQEGDQEKIINEGKQNSKKRGSTPPVVSNSESVQSVTQNDPDPTSANADVTNSNPSSREGITPQEKFRMTVADINKKENLYNTQIRALQELPPELQNKRKAQIDRALEEGRMLTPEQAGKLIEQATKTREKQIEEDAKPAKVSSKDVEALEQIIDQGFPVADIENHLEQLGLVLERSDPKYLKAVEKVIKEKIKEKYPTLKPRLQKGDVRLPNTLVPTGTVIINKQGQGVFNNDPAGMVTLLQNNVSIPLTEDQATNPNINKSFVIEKQGDEFFVKDIMIPVKGGLVSAKARINEVAVHETNYGPVKDKVRRVNALKLTAEIPDGKTRIESPFKKDKNSRTRNVSFSTLLQEAQDIAEIKKLIVATGVKMDKDYVDAAAITMSLDLQEQIYNYIDAIQNNKKLPRIDLEQSAKKNADFFARMESERKSKATRDLASLLDPNSNVHKRPDLFDPEKQAEDHFIPPAVQTIKPIGEAKLTEYIASKIDDVAAALSLDTRLRRDVKDLLNNEHHGGKRVTKNYSAEKLAVELTQFLASKGGTNQPALVLEQKLINRNLELRNPEYKLGADLKTALTLLGVTNPVMQGALDTDPQFYALIEEQLQSLVGPDVLLSYGDVKTFYKQVRKASAVYKTRAINDGRKRKHTRRKNLQEIEELGLEDGDTESVVEALEEISKTGVKPLRIIAKALLRNKDFIRSVKFVIDESPAPYAGLFYVDATGKRTVVLNTDRTNGRGVADALVHEYIHAFTHDIIHTPSEARTPAQNEAIATLEKLLQVAKSKAKKTGKASHIYATSNIDEFLAHILTDTEFQNFLSGILPADKSRTLLQKIFDSLAKMLRLPNKQMQIALEQALDLTQRTEIPTPSTKAGYANQVAGSIHRSQTELHNISKDLGMAERAALDAKLEERSKEVLEFAAGYVPRELNVVVDEDSPDIARVDSNGAVVLNPKRAAIYLANQGAEGMDAQRRKHAIGIILNKEIGKAAADNMITDGEYVSITQSMTDSEFDAEIRENYPLDEQEAAFSRLRSEDPEVAATEKFTLAKKAIARHAELSTKGMTTNQQIAFLQSNPSMLPLFIRYMKAFLSKLTYHRNLKDVSPEMRKAVNNTVIEIRALEMNYKPAPSVMNHNPRNPYAVVETLMQQAIDTNMLQPREVLASPAEGDNSFEVLEDGRLVGYRVSRLADGRAVSGADARQSTPLEGPIKMTNGFFISNRKDYVLKYYAGHDVNVVQKIAFDKKDILSGNLTDREPELRVAAGESLESETLTEEQVEEAIDNYAAPEVLITTADPTEIPVVLNKKGKPLTQGYELTKSPVILEPSGKGRKDIKPLNYDSLHYELTAPARKRLEAAIESGAVGEATDRLVDEVNKMAEDPAIVAGIGWYSRMRDVLKEALGDRHRLFSHLLGATSAQTPVETNFIYSMEVLTKLENGDYDSSIQSYLELKSIPPENLRAEIESRGIVSARKLEEADTQAKLDRLWIDHYKILPRRDNGKLYGANSMAVLKAITDTWLEGKLTPKTPQFAMNLNGDSLEATIDVWAARTLRRILWGDRVQQWRIQPKAETGVSNEDFALGQIIFREAAKKLKMSPDDLQALVWFGEKDVWDKNGWTKEVGAFKSSFDEAAEVFFPPNEPPRPLEDGKNIIKFLQKERLALSKIDSFEENSPQQKKALKEYEEARKLKGVGSYVESRGREPVAELRTASAQGQVSDGRGGQTDRSGGAGDLGRGAGAGQVLGSAAADADIDSQFREDSKIPENLFPSESQMQEKQIGNWLEILDVPLLEFSEDYEFDVQKDKGKVKKFIYKTFVRKADKRVVNFYDQNKAFVRETKGIVNEFQERHNRILDEEDARLAPITGRETGNIPPELIAQASGTTEGSQLTNAQAELVQNEYEAAIAEANKLPAEEKNAAIDLAEEKKKRKTLEFREKNRNAQFKKRDQALEDLLVLSPKMYNLVLEMRQLQDQLSKKAVEIFGPTMNPDDLNLAFDFNRGLYMTRTFRMFEDRNFAKQVKESDDYAGVRERAAAYFMKQLKEIEVKRLMLEETLTEAQARKKVEEEAVAKNSKMRSQATAMVEDFIDGYSQAETRKKVQIAQREFGEQNIVLQDAGFGSQDPLQMIVNEINKKKNIPEPIRELLGEYGEDTGLYNLSYSLNHTASIISNQAFFNKIKELGTKSENPWMVTTEQYLEDQKLGEDRKYKGWDQIATDGSSDLNPLAGMYVPKEVVSNIKDLFGGKDSDITDPLNERVEAQGYLMQATKKATGMVLALKTLGSPAFYIRNMIGNALFFGPMQGYYGGTKIFLPTEYFGEGTDTDTKSIFYKAAKGSRADLNFALIELKTRNVFGDELEVSQIAELLTGETSYKSLEKNLNKVGKAHAFIQSINKKDGRIKIPEEHIDTLAKAGVTISQAGTAPVRAVLAANNFMLETGGRLASAADGFFKVGLYDHEMKTLIKAAKYDIENGNPDGEYGRLLDSDGEPTNSMKDKAAEIVKDTAQSYSRALPVIKDLTKSNISIALAPYVRFAADVPRVYINGLIQSHRERKSDNPHIKARGRKRLFGAISTTSLNIGLTKGTQMLLWGMDDEDEDKAFRSMVPKWMKDAGILLVRDDNGDIWSVDMTYLNPFAIIQDPAIRGIESLMRGEGIGKATGKVLGGWLKPYVSEQILAGALIDAVTNKDQYDRPIRLEGDDDKFSRTVGYIFEKAFSPRSLMSADAAYDAFLSKESTSNFFQTGIGQLLKSILPFRPHKQDMVSGFNRFLITHQSQYRQAGNIFKAKVTQDDILRTDEYLDAYDRLFRNRFYQNNEFGQILRGFEKLGLSRRQIEALAKSKGVSKERLKMNKMGFMNRPILTAPTVKQLREMGAKGRTRIKDLNTHINEKHPKKQIKIDP